MLAYHTWCQSCAVGFTIQGERLPKASERSMGVIQLYSRCLKPHLLQPSGPPANLLAPAVGNTSVLRARSRKSLGTLDGGNGS